MSSLKIRRLSYALGGEITGIDLREELDAQDVAEIRAAWADLGILLVRGQELTPAQHIAFSRRLGALDDHSALYKYRHPDYPEIFLISDKIKADGMVFETSKTGLRWHSDLSYTLRPAMGSLLYCVEIAEVGGNTEFTNCYMAYETLSDSFKKLIEPLRAIHDIRSGLQATENVRNPESTAALKKLNPPVVHPIVFLHPETKRKAIYVSEHSSTRIVGMSLEESNAILQFLFRHSVRPEFTYRHQWRPNDLVMWDNRCVMHKALMDRLPGTVRHMHRTTILGEQRGELFSEELQ